MTFSGDRPGAQTPKNALPEGSFLFAFLVRKSSQVALKYRGESILINFKNLSLPRNRFRGRFSVVRIKRESGENPGQSAVKLRLRFDHTIPLVSKGAGKVSKRESVRRPAVRKRLFLLVGLEK